jgi:hypothetical protein
MSALTDILEGLLTVDVALVQRGLDALVEYHRDRVPDNPHAFEDILDHYTSAYLVLANYRDMALRVDSQYVPAGVYNIEWGPVELPNDTPDALRNLYENAVAVD